MCIRLLCAAAQTAGFKPTEVLRRVVCRQINQQPEKTHNCGRRALLLRETTFPEKVAACRALGRAGISIRPANNFNFNKIEPWRWAQCNAHTLPIFIPNAPVFLQSAVRDATSDCPIDDVVVTNVEEQGVTVMEGEACSAVSVARDYHHCKTFTQSSEAQDIKGYFSRPRLVQRLSVNTLSSGRWYFQDINPNVLFSTIWPNGFTRLAGASGIRFKLVFTVQAACNSFMQGLFSVNFQYGINSTTTSALQRSLYSAYSTHLPHVRLNLSDSTMCKLELPFMACQDYMQLVANTNPYGLLAINSLVPYFSAPGCPDLILHVYAHLEDIELVGPAYTGVVLQSGLLSRDVILQLQAGVPKSIQSRETVLASAPLSAGLDYASTSLKFLARGIPSLSSVFGMASWVAEKSAGIARVFGYARPLDVKSQIKTIHFTGGQEHNVDSSSVCQMLSAYRNNEVPIGPDIGFTDVDEMSLKFVTSQWSQIKRGTFDASSAIGSLMYGNLLSPCTMTFTNELVTKGYRGVVQYGVGDCFLGSNVYFASSYCNQWSGGFRFRLSFAKTSMHGGRILFFFIPKLLDVPDTSAPLTLEVPAATLGVGLSPDGFSKIINLRDSSEFEFEVPYIAPQNNCGFYQAIGSFGLMVMEPLTYTSTLSDKIHYILEVCGADDFTLACPRGPVNPMKPIGTVNLQSSVPGLGTAYIKEPFAQTTGEQVLSFKQIISLPHTYNCTMNGGQQATLWPWWYGSPIRIPPFGPGLLEACSTVARAYTFVRGSTDWHFYSPQGVSDFIVSNIPRFSNFVGIASAPKIICQDDSGLHVRVPTPMRTPRCLVRSLNAHIWSPRFFDTSSMTIPPYTVSADGVNIYPEVYARLFARYSDMKIRYSRCAGEDACLGHYIGPELFAYLPSAPVNGWDEDSNWPAQYYKNTYGVPDAAAGVSAIAPADITTGVPPQETLVTVVDNPTVVQADSNTSVMVVGDVVMPAPLDMRTETVLTPVPPDTRSSTSVIRKSVERQTSLMKTT